MSLEGLLLFLHTKQKWLAEFCVEGDESLKGKGSYNRQTHSQALGNEKTDCERADLPVHKTFFKERKLKVSLSIFASEQKI